jgi:hypothetical protein
VQIIFCAVPLHFHFLSLFMVRLFDDTRLVIALMPDIHVGVGAVYFRFVYRRQQWNAAEGWNACCY